MTHTRRMIAALAGLCAAAALGAPAQSQVLEIADDGAVVTYSGPSVHTDVGASLIAPSRPMLREHATTAEVVAAIQEASARHALPAPVVEAVAWQESRFNQAAISPKGARGVMQLMPGTATLLGVDASDMKSNVEGGAAYLAQQLRRFGDLRLALAAYNAGPEAVNRHGGVPPYAETQAYVRAILGRLAQSAPQTLGIGAP